VTGCKKKVEPQPTPVVEQAPAVAWVWGPATFSGSQDEGSTGVLTVRFKATNESNTGLVLNTVALFMLDADGETACSGKTSELGKAAQGDEVAGAVDITCDYTKLPETEKLQANATVMYRLGDEDRQDKVEVDFHFKR
jgi:hypothetical protein